MAWKTPKTNWVNTDYFNIADYDRIKGNIEELNSYANIMAGSGVVLPNTMSAKTASDFLYASDMNNITDNITYINSLYAKETIGSFTQYNAVGKAMTAKELNVIEKATEKIYNKYRTVTDFSLSTALVTWNVGSDITESMVYVTSVKPVTGVLPDIKWEVSGDFKIAWYSARSGVAVTPTSTSKASSGKLSCTINGVTRSAILETRQGATGITLDKEILTLFIKDKTATLTATVLPDIAYNKNVTWSSSDTSIATVDSSGVITAKNEGIVTITATTEDGNYSAMCSVGVVTTNCVTDIALHYAEGGTLATIAAYDTFWFENRGISEITFHAFVTPGKWQSYCKFTFTDSAVGNTDYSNFKVIDNGDGSCTVKLLDWWMNDFQLTCTTDLGGSITINVGDTV